MVEVTPVAALAYSLLAVSEGNFFSVSWMNGR
jgi:hypothetical protein